MLSPLGHNLQPFRFVSLHQSDKRKLEKRFAPAWSRIDSRTQWIEKYRAVAAERDLQVPTSYEIDCDGQFTHCTWCMLGFFISYITDKDLGAQLEAFGTQNTA